MKPVYLTLSRKDTDIEPCGSKWWGDPDMPVEMEYPSYLDGDGDPFPYFFICQLRMDQVAPFDHQNRLPKKGMLYFFAKIDYYLGYEGGDESFIGSGICDPKDVKVIYVPEVDVEKFETKVLVDENDESIALHELAIEFSDTSDELQDSHHLLGEAEFREWEDWDSPCEGWQVLLQVDSFEGDDFTLQFMDVGVLDFIIAPDDLKAQRFDQVRALVLST